MYSIDFIKNKQINCYIYIKVDSAGTTGNLLLGQSGATPQILGILGILDHFRHFQV